jgi:hypothetical protein
MTVSRDTIIRYRKEFRAGLLALGVPIALLAAWALIAPHGWFDNFPGGGRHWVAALGPYNEHLARDFGSVYLGLGLLLVYAGLTLDRLLVQAALVMLLIFSVPHFAYHLTQLDKLPTGDNVANMLTLSATVVLPIVLLALSTRSRQQAVVSQPSFQ